MALCSMIGILFFIVSFTGAQRPPLTPKEKCDLIAVGGKVCAPDACQNATCTLIPEAICLSDLCGCRANFFLYVSDNPRRRLESNYEPVTLLCSAATELETAKNSIKSVLSTSESAVDTLVRNPEMKQDLFKGLSTFTVDVMQIITNHLKKAVEKKPNAENLRRYQQAVVQLKKMKRPEPDFDELIVLPKGHTMIVADG